MILEKKLCFIIMADLKDFLLKNKFQGVEALSHVRDTECLSEEKLNNIAVKHVLQAHKSFQADISNPSLKNRMLLVIPH